MADPRDPLGDLPLLRTELQAGAAGEVRFSPRPLRGTGGPVYPSSASFTVHDRDGVELQSSTSATVDGGRGIAAIVCPVDAIADPQEDVQVRISYAFPDDASPRLHVEIVDVVLVPWPSLVTYRALVHFRPALRSVLHRASMALAGEGEDDLAHRDAIVEGIGVRARLKVDALVREQIAADQKGGSVWASRPRLVLNRERLRIVELNFAVAIAARMAWTGAADLEFATSSEGVSVPVGGERLPKFFEGEALRAWRAALPLRYSIDDDLVGERVTADSSFVEVERTQS